MTPRSDPHTEARIWSEPLTDNEREIIASAIRSAGPSLIGAWSQHLLACYDGLLASAVAAEARVTQLEGERDQAVAAFEIQCRRLDAIEEIIVNAERFDAALGVVADGGRGRDEAR